MSTFDGMWADLAPLGRDAATGGYRRFAWTGTDAVLREWFRGEAERRGLDVVADRAGNLWAWTADPDAEGPGLVVGSHLDSVPDGGAFDGPLGVVSAFAALDQLTATAAGRRAGRWASPASPTRRAPASASPARAPGCSPGSSTPTAPAR